MGREVRRVPADWVHPKRDDGQYQSMHGISFKEAALKWKAGFVAWEDGHNICFDRARGPDDTGEYWEYAGDPPDRAYYRPEWPEETRTHLQMYEATSEGTPISPVMKTPEELAHWLVDNNASSFASHTASYEAWLRVANGGYACSAVVSAAGIESGVVALTQREHKEDTRHDAG